MAGGVCAVGLGELSMRKQGLGEGEASGKRVRARAERERERERLRWPPRRARIPSDDQAQPTSSSLAVKEPGFSLWAEVEEEDETANPESSSLSDRTSTRARAQDRSQRSGVEDVGGATDGGGSKQVRASFLGGCGGSSDRGILLLLLLLRLKRKRREQWEKERMRGKEGDFMLSMAILTLQGKSTRD